MGREENSVNRQHSPGAEIALFRSLFRGHNDVYPRSMRSDILIPLVTLSCLALPGTLVLGGVAELKKD